MRRMLFCSPIVVALGCTHVDDEPAFFDLRLAPASTDAFVTDTGWTVELTVARAAIGPVYLRDEDHADERGPGADGVQFRGGSHGGDSSGLDPTLVAEFIHQVALDLEGEAEVVGEGRGEQRHVNVVELHLEPPSPQMQGDALVLDEAPAYVEGTATRGPDQISFVGALHHVEEDEDEDEAEDEHAFELEPDPFEVRHGGELTLTIAPAQWFRTAEFDQLSQTDEQGRKVITPGSQIGLAWRDAQADAFSAVWADP